MGSMKCSFVGAFVACVILVCFGAESAAQTKVIVIPGLGPPAPVPKTGQTESLATGDDGDRQAGVFSPSPRFVDSGNGTVTDRLTGLIWLKDGGCQRFNSIDYSNQNDRPWLNALTACNWLRSGYCSLSDDSQLGDWRLPNLKELDSLIAPVRAAPFALPENCPLADSTRWSGYWSATATPEGDTYARFVWFDSGQDRTDNKDADHAVRCVRGGQ